MPITSPSATPTQPERSRCRHIHADGRRCGSPCLRNEPFCYFHHTSRKPISRPEARRSRRSAFDLPLPEDRTSIQLSIGEILRRIALNDVDPRRAGLLLYALQIASTNLAQARHQASAAPAESPVEDLIVDPAHGPLAPPAAFVPATAPGGSRPSLIETLLDHLRTRSTPETNSDATPETIPYATPETIPDANPDARNAEGSPQADLAAEPQPASVRPSNPAPAPPIVLPVVVPILQAAIAPAPQPTMGRTHESPAMPTLRLILATVLLSTAAAFAQLPIGRVPTDPAARQVIQRGALGTPAQVFDDTETWTTPFLAVPAQGGVEIYLPDVSNEAWLKKNYRDFMDRGQFVLTLFTRYRSPEACRLNQIGWGFGDQAHLDACATDIAYRTRTATVDTNLKTVTLISAAMVDPVGRIDPTSIQTTHLVRRWAELDSNTQKALDVATAEITKQMARYDRRIQSLR